MTKLLAVRGAIDVSEDTPEAISVAVTQLMQALIEANAIAPEAVLSLFFTTTPDIHSLNPATALRQAFPSWNGVPLLCAQEPIIQNMFGMCVRVLIQWHVPDEATHRAKPVYLGKAETLRPDLTGP